MSTDLDLSRRAVAAGWRWQSGALDLWDNTLIKEVGTTDNGATQWIIGYGSDGSVDRAVTVRDLPDFNDAAMRGCLLDQVRQRRNAPHGFVICQRSRCASRYYAPNVWDWTWSFWDDTETFVASGDSEVAALVTALESVKEEVRVEN